MFEDVKKVRANQTTNDLCCEKTEELVRLKDEIFSYTFKDKPDYDKIRKLLGELRE